MLIQKIIFRIRHCAIARLVSFCRCIFYSVLGMRIGSGTNLNRIAVTWPHKVKIGTACMVEQGVIFKYDGPYSPGRAIIIGDRVFIGAGVEFNVKEQIKVGNDSLIGSGTRFIDHDHGFELGMLIRQQLCPTAAITIGSNCWIGANVVILKGVTVGDGAVVAAGGVLNKSIPPMEIWGGVPARRISIRGQNDRC